MADFYELRLELEGESGGEAMLLVREVIEAHAGRYEAVAEMQRGIGNAEYATRAATRAARLRAAVGTVRVVRSRGVV